MKPLYQLLNIKALLFGPLAILVLASCGSYQYAGYDHDGIYSSGSSVAQGYSEAEQTESYENALYYQQVFSRQADQFEQIAQADNAIFTDIDSYSSGTYDENAYTEEGYPVAHGGWGNEADEISVNIYNTGFGYPGYYSYAPYYDPFFYNDYYWAHSYGYGPYGWGYSPFRWNYGYAGFWGSHSWGYGYPYYGNYGYPYGYYGNHYYGNNYYGNHYYGNSRNVAYNNSRRNSSADYNSGVTRSNSYLNNSRYSDNSNSTYSNRRNVRATTRSNEGYSISRNTRENAVRTGSAARPVRVESPQQARSNRASSSRTTPQVRSRTQSSQPIQQVRSSSNTRSSTGTYRSSIPTTRSSGTTSGSSSRSSRGRGN